MLLSLTRSSTLTSLVMLSNCIFVMLNAGMCLSISSMGGAVIHQQKDRTEINIHTPDLVEEGHTFSRAFVPMYWTGITHKLQQSNHSINSSTFTHAHKLIGHGTINEKRGNDQERCRIGSHSYTCRIIVGPPRQTAIVGVITRLTSNLS